jgi:hypothetical protein
MLSLDEDQLNSLNAAIGTQSEEQLTLGVYPMQIVKITNFDKEKGILLSDKNGEAYLKMAILTGFKKQDGGNRYFVQNFHLEGKYNDGTPKINTLAKFLKRCFKMDKVTTDNINAIVGRKIAVATRKDNEGYISYWYAGHIDELKEMKATYKAKDDSNGQRASRPVNNIPPPPDEMSYEDLPF